MKKTYFIILTAFIAVTGTFVACHENVFEETVELDKSIEALVNFNPEEPIIMTFSNDKGESMAILGTKDETGAPVDVQHLVISALEEENPTEIFFNENKQIEEIIAPNGVRFQFEWLSEKETALTLIDPETNEQLNTYIDFSKVGEEMPEPEETKSVFAETRTDDCTLTVTPLCYDFELQEQVETRASGERTGHIYVTQCGRPASGQCFVNVYDYSNLNTGWVKKGRFRGRFNCTEVEKGHYQFKLPANYHEHHNIADYCDELNNVINFICTLNEFTAPGAKQYLCLQISLILAKGIVTAPVAVGFGTACTAISTAMDIGCELTNGKMNLPTGAPNLVDGLCQTLREMDFSWDTPLIVTPFVNGIPNHYYGLSQELESDEPIKDTYISLGNKPAINSFKLNPPAPTEGQSYDAIANLFCIPENSTVTIDIVGTDGYSNKKIIDVNANTSNHFEATLHVPGAGKGVKDVCTVKVVTSDGETITKKASLVFQ